MFLSNSFYLDNDPSTVPVKANLIIYKYHDRNVNSDQKQTNLLDLMHIKIIAKLFSRTNV